MDDLTRIGIETGTDKAYYHTFTKFYEQYFKNIRSSDITILEIGICEGASLQMLKSYFPNAQIHAIDTNPNSVRNYGERINTYLCSQTDSHTLQKLFGSMMFDIIIDDGSHICSHQQISLGLLFPLLKPGGFYICEDIHTSFNSFTADTNPTTYQLLESKSFVSKFIPLNVQRLLSEKVNKIELYRRKTLPYKCWKCKNEYHICNCNLNMYPTHTDSQTSIIIRNLY